MCQKLLVSAKRYRSRDTTGTKSSTFEARKRSCTNWFISPVVPFQFRNVLQLNIFAVREHMFER